MPRKQRQTQTPGAQTADTAPDAEKALEAGRAGGTHRVAKHPDPETLPKSPVKGDPERRQSATVNSRKEMSYAEAMKRLAMTKELRKLKKLANPTDAERRRMDEIEPQALTRSVLTEQGWVAVAPERKEE